MKLLQSPQCRAALEALADAIEAEAVAAGETPGTMVIVAFTEEDRGCRVSITAGCSCPSCLGLVAKTVAKMAVGSLEGKALFGQAVH